MVRIAAISLRFSLLDAGARATGGHEIEAIDVEQCKVLGAFPV
jgi:hypothetical protein